MVSENNDSKYLHQPLQFPLTTRGNAKDTFQIIINAYIIIINIVKLLTLDFIVLHKTTFLFSAENRLAQLNNNLHKS